MVSSCVDDEDVHCASQDSSVGSEQPFQHVRFFFDVVFRISPGRVTLSMWRLDWLIIMNFTAFIMRFPNYFRGKKHYGCSINRDFKKELCRNCYNLMRPSWFDVMVAKCDESGGKINEKKDKRFNFLWKILRQATAWKKKKIK